MPTGRRLPLRYARDGESFEHDPAGGRLVFNHGEALTDAAALGLGVAQVPAFHAAAAVAAGALVPVLAGWDAPGRPVQLVYPSGRHLSPRVRAFVDFVVAALGARAPGG